MLTLINNTKHKVQFDAAGCTPESGVIEANSSVQVTAPRTVFEVLFGGTSESPVRVRDVPEHATVTLSVTVEPA